MHRGASVIAWIAWAMHSNPARVDKAYWNGAVTFVLICCAMVLDTNLRMVSPATMPRTPPPWASEVLSSG